MLQKNYQAVKSKETRFEGKTIKLAKVGIKVCLILASSLPTLFPYFYTTWSFFCNI